MPTSQNIQRKMAVKKINMGEQKMFNIQCKRGGNNMCKITNVESNALYWI